MRTVLRDRYELGPVVGSGAHGEVYRAHDRRHDRTVAIKSRPDGDASEARALYAVRPHPNLPLLREDFVQDGRLWLVMDWVEGQNLAGELATSEPVGLRDAEAVLRPVAEAIDHLHRHDPPVMHGDVKPANVVRGAGGRIVLVDLGLVPRSARTPAYQGESDDIGGLAAIAGALLTGRTDASAPMPHVPDEDRVRRVLAWGMAAPRPASASAFVDALVGESFAHNLPEHLTAFVGRSEELARVSELVRGHRIVSVVGPGGSGKTRLAIEAARGLGPFTGGVLLVDLVAVTSGVAARVFETTGATDPGTDPLEAVVAVLADAPKLVILDNADHVVAEAASVCEAIGSRCPYVRFLVTSRTALGVPDERVVGLWGLPADEAAELLLARVRDADPGWDPSSDELAAADTIAERLEGLPLALELAAARAVRDGLVGVSASVAGRLDALGELRGTAAHHRTLTAMVDHSFELLDGATQRILRSASVLIGGVDPAVLASIADEGESDVRTALDRAARASMAEVADDRWRILEPVRQRLVDHLSAAGEEAVRLERMRTWAADLFRGPRTLETFRREEPNLREAIRAVLANEDVDDALVDGLFACYEPADRRSDLIRLWRDARDARRARGDDLPAHALANLGMLLAGHRRSVEALAVLSEVIERDDGRARVAALVTRGLEMLRGDPELAREDLDEAERLLGGTDAPKLRTRLLLGRVVVCRTLGDLDGAEEHASRYEATVQDGRMESFRLRMLSLRIPIAVQRGDLAGAMRLAEELLARSRESGSVRRLAEAWHALGLTHMLSGRPDEAEPAFLEAAELWRSVDDPRHAANSLYCLGSVALQRGDVEDAVSKFRRSLEAGLASGDTDAVLDATLALGEAARAAGRLDEARRWLMQAIPKLREKGKRYELAHALSTESRIASDEGDTTAALDAAREALSLFEQVSDGPMIAELRERVASLESG